MSMTLVKGCQVISWVRKLVWLSNSKVCPEQRPRAYPCFFSISRSVSWEMTDSTIEIEVCYNLSSGTFKNVQFHWYGFFLTSFSWYVILSSHGKLTTWTILVTLHKERCKRMIGVWPSTTVSHVRYVASTWLITLTCFDYPFAACPFVFVEDSGVEVR